MAKNETSLESSQLFQAGIRKNNFEDLTPVSSMTMADVENTLSSLTGTFRFDSPGAPLKSTQQLNVDFSDFSNHTFFNSAQAKTQKAFQKIINNMPFDGTKSNLVEFVDGLSGFEKYVLDNFPKNNGYLAFSGSSGASGGSYIEINDFKGANSFTLAENPTGVSVIDPGTKPFTFEFFINVPSGSQNDNQIIAQKLSGSNGITLCLSSSASKASPEGEVDFLTLISSGSLCLSASITIPKGKFTHIASVFDRTTGPGKLTIYKDAIFDKNDAKSSSSVGNLGDIDFKTSQMFIGSGSEHSFGNYVFTPQETLSGALDELKMWHARRTQKEIYNDRFLDTFAQNNLQILYRFNEPSGSFTGTGENLVLDSSGNGLHANIQNFSMFLRNTGTYGPAPVTEYSSDAATVLFPSYADTISLNEGLLTEALSYDANNPNVVTKLIPSHYLRDAAQFEGFETKDADLNKTLSNTQDEPGGATVGQAQIIAGMLYTFSETFDELKMFVDEFKRLLKVDVITNETISNQLLPWLSRYYGISLPNFFSTATSKQFSEGKNVSMDRTNSTSLQTVQNMLWRRIFSDLPYIFSTRGTHASLRSVLSNLGISPNGPIRIREFGGSKQRNLGDSFLKRHEIAALLNMSGTLADPGTLNPQGIDSTRPFLLGSYLSGSRSEPGIPLIDGTLSDGVSNDPSDGLFTSGSWSVEGTYKFEDQLVHNSLQSLVRLHSTGTNSASSSHGVLFNLLALKPDVDASVTGSLTLYGRPSSAASSDLFTLHITGVNVFDGGKWSIAFGRDRNDLINSYTSSSYFLRAGKFSPAGLQQFFTTSSYFNDSSSNVLQNIDAYNTSGTFLVVGSQSLDVSTARFLNDPAVTGSSRETRFSGKLSGLRFWSKGLTEKESLTHVKNFKSLGVEDPEVNFNFVTSASGSFQRLRQDVSIDQPITKSDASGDISFFDFSQNLLTFTGTGFESNKQVIDPERFDFEVISPNFQSGENPNKIRVRSYLNHDNITAFGGEKAPLYHLPQNEQPQDDKRVSIEVSVVQALNEDIMNIFATLDTLDNVIGSPELIFSQDYPQLRNLRRIYFQRLTEKINLQSFFEFFKWFDSTIIDLLVQMLPSNSKFSGASYVIESHALERPKFTYKYYDMYLGESDRGGKEVIELRQLVGTIRKL